jgi:hypothetical protein
MARPGRLRLVLAAVVGAALGAGCGSRYHAADCPADPLPEASEVLRRPGFDRLRYFRATDASTDRVDYETWADGKFDFATSLTYHYPAIDGQRSDCARGVTLTLHHPASEEGKALRGEFIGLLGRRLGTELPGMTAAAADYDSKQGEGFLAPRRFELGPLVGEVVGVNNYHRGAFLTVGFYDRVYDQAARRPLP